MDWVALSSSYYLDPKLEGCNASVERMFTRILAYCGAHETGGKVPKDVHKYVGLARSERALHVLISSGILQPTDDGRLQFTNWSRWQRDADDLVKLRKSNRDRKRKERETTENMSRDKRGHVTRAQDLTQQDKTELPNESKSVASPTVTGRDEPSEHAGPVVPVDGWTLIRRVVPPEHPQATKTALALKAAELLHAGTTTDDVEAAVAEWCRRPDARIGLLPHLVSDAIRSRDQPPQATSGTTTKRVNGWLDIGREAAAMATPDTTKEIPP